MNYQKCIKNNKNICIGREKFLINGKVHCCHEEIADEHFIALSLIDAIEDCRPTRDNMSMICSRLSYATDMISFAGDTEKTEVFFEFKRFSRLVYEHQERILSEQNLLSLACTFVNFVKQWFDVAILNNTVQRIADNCIDSIRADLHALEMSLGLCVLPSAQDNLDDIFF